MHTDDRDTEIAALRARVTELMRERDGLSRVAREIADIVGCDDEWRADAAPLLGWMQREIATLKIVRDREHAGRVEAEDNYTRALSDISRLKERVTELMRERDEALSWQHVDPEPHDEDDR